MPQLRPIVSRALIATLAIVVWAALFGLYLLISYLLLPSEPVPV